MTQYKHWLPGSRAGIMAMVQDWLLVAGSKGTVWNITEGALNTLQGKAVAAEDALAIVETESTRTPVATAQCREAFDALTAAMRDFKRRYFLTPPLTDPDYIALGLKPHDSIPTPGSTPSAQAMVETFLTGRHELGIKLIYVSGDANAPANKGFRIWYSVAGAGETPPALPDDLRKSFYTRRKKDVIEFDFSDSGKTVFFAVQIENDGKKGPWGPLTSALIP